MTMATEAAARSNTSDAWGSSAQRSATIGWFAQYMPPPEQRQPMTPGVFASYVLPAYLCCYAMAVLVLLPGTRVYRLALLPPALYIAFKSVVCCDASSGVPEYNHWNYGHGVGMFLIAMRMSEWAFLEKPPRRTSSMGKEEERRVFRDALDLVCNLRGVGWDWSRGLHVPPETRPTHDRRSFVLSTASRFLRDLLLCDALHYTLQLSAPHTLGSTTGGRIIDPSRPPLARYARSTALTLLSGGVVYTSVLMVYHGATVLALLLPGPLRQRPADWPPLSEAPWRATSLADFWARRWHQSFRRPFVALGGRPLRALGGRAGGVIGVFLLSAVLHDWCIWGMGRGTDFARLGGFFVLNGVGIVLERLWERVVGRKVGGWPGWAWTMFWMTWTGHLLVDAWLTRGIGGIHLVPPPLRAGKLFIDAFRKYTVLYSPSRY